MFRERGQHHAAHLVSERGIRMPVPADTLFVHRWMYEWGLLFEYSIAAYWAGDPSMALRACDQLLGLPELPREYRRQTEVNRAHCLQAVGRPRGGSTTATRRV
jgi:hypothetical protein